MRVASLMILLGVALLAPGRTGRAAASPADPAAPFSLSGTVVDSAGGAVAGAAITLDAGPAGERAGTTDATGRFAFDDVRPARPA